MEKEKSTPKKELEEADIISKFDEIEENLKKLKE